MIPPGAEKMIIIHMRQLIEDLVEAVKTGECPDRTCPRCAKKWATVTRARELLAIVPIPR